MDVYRLYECLTGKNFQFSKEADVGALREWFGPSKDEVWSQLSQEIGAEHQPDGFFKNGKVVLSHRQWEITLDTYTVSTGKSHITYTRIRAPYVNQNGFRFNIYRENIFSQIGKLFGMKDIETGDSFFDNEFVIQGEPEQAVLKLLMNTNIRQLIQNQPDIHFQVRDDEGWFGAKFPEGVDELYFEVVGIITDKERLKQLFELFSQVLDGLCDMGSAYTHEAGVKLE